MNIVVDMQIDAAILAALNENNITIPTEIQASAIPFLMEGKDVIGQAQTGTGKTFAYAIPLIGKVDAKKKSIQALIMCPTRELSLQVCKEIEKLLKYTKLKATTIYGGESYEKQFKALAKNPQIIIGTPGRIIDHLHRGTIHFNEVSYLVLDEADEMLKMGFQEDMETILKEVPATRQTSLFSATLPGWVRDASKKYMAEPVMVRIEQKTLTVEKIKEVLYYVKKEQKKDLLVRLLDYYQLSSVMILQIQRQW
ncbi:MAG: DEAD/DEAH box helicase [Anaeroplasmataceae bacterium]|nr:DEAD/DEAH box helicase [Anaeroplasmataceae bacterium]